MKKRFLPLAGLVALTLAGCLTPSVNPFYTEKDLVFDPALVGGWGDRDGGERWDFVRDGDKAYTWTCQEKTGRSEFRAHLLQLGDLRLLDALLVHTKGEWKGDGSSRIAMVVRPAHLIFKLQFTNSALRLQGLSQEWMERLLKAQPAALAHEWLKEPDNDDQRAILTAPTAELQRFILEHAADPKMFTDGDPVPRIDGPSPVPAP